MQAVKNNMEIPLTWVLLLENTGLFTQPVYTSSSGGLLESGVRFLSC